MNTRFFSSFISLFLLFTPVASYAQNIGYIVGSQVAVRVGPGLEHLLLMRLNRGDPVQLDNADFADAAKRTAIQAAEAAASEAARLASGETPKKKAEIIAFCRITDPVVGFVACQFLSQVKPPAAADAAERVRYVSANHVNVRAGPSLQASRIEILAINSKVVLINEKTDSSFCAVDFNGKPAYIACQYLSQQTVTASVSAQNLQELEAGLIQAQQNFAAEPSYWALWEYLGLLEKKHTSEGRAFTLPAPRVASAERMKAQLEAGVLLQPSVEAVNLSAVQSSDTFASLLPIVAVHQSALQNLREVALTSDDIARRYQIAMRTLFTLRKLNVSVDPSTSKEVIQGLQGGTWDIHKYTSSLTQPVYEHRLYSDGSVVSKTSFAESTAEVKAYGSDEMCSEFEAGFAYGGADEIFLKPPTFNGASSLEQVKALRAGIRAAAKPGDPILLITFYTRGPQNFQGTKPIAIRMTTDAKKLTYLNAQVIGFDLNGDGIPDIVLVKGTQQTGQDELHANAKPEPMHRSFFINVRGAWHHLATDTFQYGCGC